MKKAITILLALVLTFSFAACSGGSTATEVATPASTEEPKPGNFILNVGDTAHGEICDVTITSVENVAAIKDGLIFHMWSPAERTDYQDVTAENGYSIIKISFHFDYTGKSNGRFSLDFALDYDDGYVFTTGANHLMPATESGIGFSKSYGFVSTNTFEIDDPLSYTGEDAIAYIVVNDTVITDTDKPLVLRVYIPKSPNTFEPMPGGNGLVETAGDTEEFSFDVRSVDFDIAISASSTKDEQNENNRYEKTGKVIGPNPHNPSLNEKYGDNSWDIKYGNNPLRDLVFFRDDVDVSSYIGKDVTFSYEYIDGHCVDAYIVK